MVLTFSKKAKKVTWIWLEKPEILHWTILSPHERYKYQFHFFKTCIFEIKHYTLYPLNYQNLHVMKYQHNGQQQIILFLYALSLPCNLQIWCIIPFHFLAFFLKNIIWTKLYHYVPKVVTLVENTLNCCLCP